ncbi:RND superfamily putative drug exporter [Arthrobacter bambusae]|uniref:RND superfamily putative drug exporter n=3 Tax=Arthrobacter TaxID=1663 RepID=A0AAW8DFT3_9MICC|nr:RND superfamily putative drug exporter [Arthrobacter bambusae]MDQ0130857.1 RND superfamily putative drug exporter [Arthrobacter bambusae]MDQ0182286.1 RND superfamily putative drug exporter [Arthrobacter bambusae]
MEVITEGAGMMDKRIGTGRRSSSRWWLAGAVLSLVAWMAIGGIGGPTFGKLSEVSSNDQASFLPASAESTEAREWQSKFTSSGSVPAVVLIESPEKLSPAQLAGLAPLGTQLSAAVGVSHSTSTVGPIPSTDGKAAQFIVPVEEGNGVKGSIQALREKAAGYAVGAGLPAGTTTYVTGPAGFLADLVNAFGGIDGILLFAALGAVLVILLAVYRSVVLPFVVLLTAVFALCGSILVVFALAKAGAIQLTGQSQGILSILVVGSATDYALLFVARYREALGQASNKWSAVGRAYKGSFGAILASGTTVALALLCLLFSELNSNRGLGPIGAIGIVFSMVASLTLLPAALGLLGKSAFWPRAPRTDPAASAGPSAGVAGVAGPAGSDIPRIWRLLASIIAKRPRAVWLGAAAVLVVCALGLLQLQASGVPQSALILSKSEAVDGQTALGRHYPAGAGSPVVVVADEKAAVAVLAEVKAQEGISDASVVSAQPDSGVRPLAKAATEPAPLVRDGRVLINATLSSEADSAKAEQTIATLRQRLHEKAPGTLVGGTTATAADTNASAQSDLWRIIPIVLAVILLVLMALLRSVLAPLLLIGTVVLSYAAALGVSAWVFNHVFGFPGADASVPLFGFVFLVALGVDYNIFLMTRVREESTLNGTRAGILKGLGATGGVITSAGVVLAATFAALGVIPILFLAQISFIVAFGVLLDTTIVRSLLVPALAYDIGGRIWWPGRLARDPASKAGQWAATAS